MKNKNTILICVSLLLMISCKTAEFGFDTFDICGMIYDFSGRPVPFYNISLGNKLKITTDINGRFVFPKVPAGKYTIIGSKKGYEVFIDDIIINDGRQIIYIRTSSQEQLLEMIDDALSRNDINEAEKILERAFRIDHNNIEMLFYSAVVNYRRKNYEKAVYFLEYAKNLGFRDIYIDKFLKSLKEIQNDV